eukprot:4284231-Amphidinium_carterae.1
MPLPRPFHVRVLQDYEPKVLDCWVPTDATKIWSKKATSCMCCMHPCTATESGFGSVYKPSLPRCMQFVHHPRSYTRACAALCDACM